MPHCHLGEQAAAEFQILSPDSEGIGRFCLTDSWQWSTLHQFSPAKLGSKPF